MAIFRGGMLHKHQFADVPCRRSKHMGLLGDIDLCSGWRGFCQRFTPENYASKATPAPPKIGRRDSRRRRAPGHEIKFLEILLGQGCQLRVTGVIAGNAVGHFAGQCGLVLLTPLAKLVASQAWASQQHLMHILQGGGYRGEHLRGIAGRALMLVVTAGFDALSLNVLPVKHHHMGFLMV